MSIHPSTNSQLSDYEDPPLTTRPSCLYKAVISQQLFLYNWMKYVPSKNEFYFTDCDNFIVRQSRPNYVNCIEGSLANLKITYNLIFVVISVSMASQLPS